MLKGLFYQNQMKKFFISVLILIQSLFVAAQQLPEASYFMYDYARTNPGSFGSTDMICITGLLRQGFVGMPENPRDLYLNGDVPFNLFGAKHGAGISILSDKIGRYKNLNFKLGYAFRFNVGEGTLGLGFSGNILQYYLDGSEWIGTETIDPNNDPNIPQGKSKANGFGANVGLFYRTEDIYFGASVLNLYTSEMKYSGEGGGSTGVGGSDAKENLRPHYYITAGYYLQLTNPAFELQPAVNLFSDGTTVTFDLNTTLTYNKKLWGGVSYRAGSSAIGMVGLMVLDGLKVGYAYDFQTSALSRYSGGSHEIMLNYCFKVGIEKTPQRYKSIRYL